MKETLQSIQRKSNLGTRVLANNFLSYCNKSCNNWDLLNYCNNFTCNNEFWIIAIKLLRNKFAITLQYFLVQIFRHPSCKHQLSWHSSTDVCSFYVYRNVKLLSWKYLVRLSFRTWREDISSSKSIKLEVCPQKIRLKLLHSYCNNFTAITRFIELLRNNFVQ